MCRGGSLSAGGFYTKNGGRLQAFVADEETAAGNAAGTAHVRAQRYRRRHPVRLLPSPGNCGGAGQYFDDRGISQALVVDETNGTWGTAQPVPEMSMLNPTRSEADSISCPSAGNCGLAGAYADGQGNQQVFIVDEVNGTWGTPQQVPGTGALNTGGNAVVNQISCGSPGNCAVVGFYTDKNGHTHGFTADEKRGIWQTLHKLASKGAFSASTNTGAASVSCPSAGNCVPPALRPHRQGRAPVHRQRGQRQLGQRPRTSGQRISQQGTARRRRVRVVRHAGQLRRRRLLPRQRPART